MSTISFDSSEVNALALDLSRAPGRMQRSAPKTFARMAFETKGNLQRDATGHGHLPQLQSHVAYDRIGDLDYEIGFNKSGQGNLAVLAVYGSTNNSPVMGTPMDALRRELPAAIRHLGGDAEDAVLGGGS